MNSFFKTFWAALLAFLAANFILGMISIFFFAALVASIGTATTGMVSVGQNSVLKIDLEETVTDSPPSSPLDRFDFMAFKPRPTNSILEIVSAIERAMVDSRIKGIYLNIQNGRIGTANTEELRAALLRFKESGKFIVSYGNTYSQRDYYLCSVADSVYMNPKGAMDWHGLASQVMFYKGLLDKLGVQPEVLRHGSFKAAVEPFILDKMSDENRVQMNALTGSVWGALVSEVAASRELDSTLLQQYASALEVYSPEQAVALGFVDGLLYADQVKATLNALLANEPDDDPDFITLPNYISATMYSTAGKSKNHVQIIYADGDIVDGRGARGQVGGDALAARLARARGDERVKAVVLRVNSPGGSALASEVIWREMELLKAVKPVVVSMGNVAASGGYYIACPADIVLANRMTITGSIGVFGLTFDAGKALKDKLGITVDVARTNPSADIGSIYRPMTPAERTYIMRSIEDIYKTFVGHVAAGRNLAYNRVDSIAGGRVWSGTDALRIGLIDGFGGLRDAILLAADRAGVAGDYTVSEATEASDPFSILMNALTEARLARLKNELGDAFIHYNHLQNILSQHGIQARMPYIIDMQ